MFERFTGRARGAVVHAQEEAASLGHAYIGTEHLLIGLLREEDGIAAHALASLDVTPSRAREQVVSIVGRGEDYGVDEAPFTPRSKKALELGLRESLRLGHDHIGTEHILLGVVEEGEGGASQVLSNLGVRAEEVREQVIFLLASEASRGASLTGTGRDGGPAISAERRVLFQGEVQAFDVEVRYGALGETVVPQIPHTVTVELNYTYTVQIDADVLLGTMDPGDVRERVAGALQGEEFVVLEAGLVRAGDSVLEEFPQVEEISIAVTVPRSPDPGRSSGMRITGTARR